MKESSHFFKLLWIRFKTQQFFIAEYWKSVSRYYRKFSFAKADFLLIFGYMFKSPYKVSRDFLKSKKEDNIYAYGETPLTTLEAICKECKVAQGDTIFELGCGRGRTCFWLNQWLGCKVVGIEFVPEFVEIADIIKKSCDLENIELRCEDFTESSLEGASVVYLFGTCLKDEDIEKLSANIARLPSGTKVISVSYPLTEYEPSNSLKIVRRFPGRFAWGEADVYYQIIS